MKKHILVTGGAGFIGSNLSRGLLEEGHEVWAIDNFITSSPENIVDLLQYPSFHFVKADVCDSNFLPVDATRIDEVYHLACPTGVDNLIRLAEEMMLTCTIGTRNVLEVALKFGSKVVFSSSSEVYGDPEMSPQAEEYSGNVDPIGTRSPYEEGKRASETLVKIYAVKYGLTARIVRIFNTYGPRMWREDSRVIPAFLRSLQQGRPIIIYGDGSQSRTFCYIDDLVESLFLVMEKGESGVAYNVGSSAPTSIRELGEIMSQVLGAQKKVEFRDHFVPDHKSRLPDLSRVHQLGWREHTDLEQGLYKTALWFG